MAGYKKVSKNIQQIIIDNPRTENTALTWINICDAGASEMEYLRKNYNFNLSHLKASTSKVFSQRPKIEQGSGYLFLTLHFPILINGQIVAEEINFFISHGYMVTLHSNKINAVNDFFNLCKKDNDSSLAYEHESSAILLYEILDKLMLACYPLLDQSSIAITEVEDIIFSRADKRSVTEILSLRHNIINFRKIMQNHKNIIKKLMGMESSVVAPENIKGFYSELIDHSKTIWEILENQKEMIEIIYQTNESLLSYKMGDIMKTLTIFSVIVFPLTLLAAIFGMNTVNGMPFADSEHGFWYIIAIMLTGSLGMLLFFEKKKWL